MVHWLHEKWLFGIQWFKGEKKTKYFRPNLDVFSFSFTKISFTHAKQRKETKIHKVTGSITAATGPEEGSRGGNVS